MNDAIKQTAKLGADATASLHGIGPALSGLTSGTSTTAVDKLANAYQSVTVAIQQMQEQTAKPVVAAQDAYARGMASARAALQADEKEIASKKLTTKTLAQVQQEYSDLTLALWQRLQLQLGQIDDQEKEKAQKVADAKAKAFKKMWAQATVEANAYARTQAAAWDHILDGIAKGAEKVDETFDQQQARVDKATDKLTQMRQHSSDATLSAGDKIRAEYQRQIAAINQLVAAQTKKGVSDEQATKLTKAAAAAQHSALEQEKTDLAKLRQQQMMTEATQINSFIEMGLAAAGYRNTVVKALMDVIKVIEQELIAHLASAAGATAAENVKSLAVGKGVGIRSTWHAMEQFAMALADTAVFNFAGAAAHFAAAGAFTSVAASVGTAVAGLFASTRGAAASR